MIGEITLRRPYFYCENCKKGFHPLDDALILSDTVKQWDMQEASAIVEDVGRLGAKADTEVVVCGSEEVDLKELLYLLWQRGVNRLMVEGGGTLNWSLLSQRLVDEVYIYVGNVVIGGDGAPTPVGGPGFVSEEELIKLELISADKMDEGVLLKWRVINRNQTG